MNRKCLSRWPTSHAKCAIRLADVLAPSFVHLHLYHPDIASPRSTGAAVDRACYRRASSPPQVSRESNPGTRVLRYFTTYLNPTFTSSLKTKTRLGRNAKWPFISIWQQKPSPVEGRSPRRQNAKPAICGLRRQVSSATCIVPEVKRRKRQPALFWWGISCNSLNALLFVENFVQLP